MWRSRACLSHSAAVTIAQPSLDNPEAALKALVPVRGTVYFEAGDLR